LIGVYSRRSATQTIRPCAPLSNHPPAGSVFLVFREWVVPLLAPLYWLTTGPLGPLFRPGVAAGRHLSASHAVQAICARTRHLGLFALDVNAEPSAPLRAPSTQRRAHQGQQRRARRHLSITWSAMASSVGGAERPGLCGSEQPGIWKRFQMPARTFAISQPNSMVSALTAVGSQSISTGLISRRQFSEIRLVRRRHSGAPSMEVFIRVFGADHFRPLALAPITHGGRPRLGENAVILDGELKLQSVALVVRVARKTRIPSEP
jgi:hypothetical protein